MTRTPLPGDTLRDAARSALAATQRLEKALARGDVEQARDALQHGALPELAVFRNKKGMPTSSAVARALEHDPSWLALLHLLLEFEAPLPVAGEGAALQAALRHDRIEAISLIAQRAKPRPADWMEALGRSLSTFRALDDACPMDRCKPLGTKHKTGYPPLFLVHDPQVLDYLLQTGAQATQTPGFKSGDEGKAWGSTTCVRYWLSNRGARARAGYMASLLPMVQTVQACGVVLSQDDFEVAGHTRDEPLFRHFLDEGFPLPDNLLDGLDPMRDRLQEYQRVLRGAKTLDASTAASEGSGAARRL